MSWWNPATWFNERSVTDPAPSSVSISPAASFIPFGNRDIESLILNTSGQYLAAIRNCAPLAAILLACADAFSNGTFEVLNRATQNYTRGKYKEWDELLANPNPFANKSEFLQTLYLYTRMNGWCYAMPVYPAGFKDRPTSVFLLPPWCIEIELIDRNKPLYTYKRGDPMRRVWFNYNGARRELKEQELILFKDNSLSLCPDTLLPESVLKNLHYPISMFISSEEAGITTVQKKGPMGILSNKGSDTIGDTPLYPNEKEELQQDLAKYGLTRAQWQYIITSQNLDWIPITSNIADLRLDENKLGAVKSLCSVLKYPFDASPWAERSTYNNVTEAEKKWYQGGIIPQANSLIEQLNRGLNTTSSNIEITVSYQDIYVFQQSEKERGEGRKAMGDAAINEYKNNIITLNRALELLQEDTIPNGDYYFRDSPEQQQALDMQRLRFSNRNTNQNAGAEQQAA